MTAYLRHECVPKLTDSVETGGTRSLKLPIYRYTDADSSPRYGKGFFSQSRLVVQTLLRCPYSPRVKSQASTPVRRFKKTKPTVALFGHTKILHTLVGMRSAAHASAVPYIYIYKWHAGTTKTLDIGVRRCKHRCKVHNSKYIYT